jgi:hypothetical protein
MIIAIRIWHDGTAASDAAGSGLERILRLDLWVDIFTCAGTQRFARPLIQRDSQSARFSAATPKSVMAREEGTRNEAHHDHNC